MAAAGPDWEDPAVGRREAGQAVGLRLENKVAEIVGALGMGLAVAPGAVGACGAADMVVLPGCEEQKLAQGGVALGKVSGHPVVPVGAVSRGFAAGLDEEPGQAGRNTVPGPESHNLLLPAVHKIPSVDHMAWYPYFQGFFLAFPLGIAGDLESHNPGLGNRVPVVDLWGAPAVTADRMDCLQHIVGLSFSPLDPWDQVAGS